MPSQIPLFREDFSSYFLLHMACLFIEFLRAKGSFNLDTKPTNASIDRGSRKTPNFRASRPFFFLSSMTQLLTDRPLVSDLYYLRRLILFFRRKELNGKHCSITFWVKIGMFDKLHYFWKKRKRLEFRLNSLIFEINIVIIAWGIFSSFIWNLHSEPWRI